MKIRFKTHSLLSNDTIVGITAAIPLSEKWDLFDATTFLKKEISHGI
jgi:hypothetical protein